MKTYGNPSVRAGSDRSAPISTRKGESGTARAGNRGFSLLEIIGVLTIMSLLAVALLPSMIKVMDREARSSEARNVERLGDGLAQYILRTHNIPAPGLMSARIAEQLGVRTDDVTKNGRGMRRVILVDPGVTGKFPTPASSDYIYNQGILGNTTTDFDTNVLGVVIVSSIGTALPDALVTGYASSTEAFRAYWNASEGQIPQGLSWNGDGSDLCIQRVNLASQFIRLTLCYQRQGTNTPALTQGLFAVDGTVPQVIPNPSLPFDSYYVKGTLLCLYNQSEVQAKEVLQNFMCYIFKNNIWRSPLLIGPDLTTTPSLSDMQTSAEIFASSTLNAKAQGNPQTTLGEALAEMTDFMVTYTTWANAGFPMSGDPLLAAVTTAQHNLDDSTEDIIHMPGIPERDNDLDGDGYGVAVHDLCTQEEHSNHVCHDDGHHETASSGDGHHETASSGDGDHETASSGDAHPVEVEGGDGTCNHHGDHDAGGFCLHRDGSDCNECIHATASSSGSTSTPTAGDGSIVVQSDGGDVVSTPPATNSIPTASSTSTNAPATISTNAPTVVVVATNTSTNSTVAASTTTAGVSTGTATTTTTTHTTTTTTTCTSSEDPKVKSNNGHGNNIDGYDCSNPGNKPGIDASGSIDDEKSKGKKP